MVPLGYPTPVRVYALPVHQQGREMAPAVGSVPIVTVRPVSGQRVHGRRVLRFIGTPLDRRLRSSVWIAVPGRSSRHGGWSGPFG